MAKNKSGKRRTTHSRGPGGEKVVTISGKQIYVDVHNNATSSQLFSGTNAVGVSPDYFGTTIAAIGDRYNKYFFSRLGFEYKPGNYNLTTTTSNNMSLFAFGYNNEGNLDFAVTFNNICMLQHNIVVPTIGYRAARDNILWVKPNRPASGWLFNENDTANSATLRQTVQGLLVGESVNSITDAQDWGKIYVHYTVHFLDLTPDQGFTLAGLRRELAMADSAVVQRIMAEFAAAERNVIDEVEVVPKQFASAVAPTADSRRPLIRSR